MVVTRKPSIPLPVTPSRSNSTSNPAKDKDDSHSKGAKSPLANGVSANISSLTEDKRKTPTKDSNKTHAKSKKKSNVQPVKKSKKAGNWLFRLLILIFTAYTITVCPRDYLLDSPVCSCLSVYREYVIQPLIMPPVLAIARHPLIAPHIIRFEPMIHQTVRLISPYVSTVRRFWNVTIISTWQKHVMPQVKLLGLYFRPYREQIISKYDAALSPYIQVIRENASMLRNKVVPYVRTTTTFCVDGWEYGRPYIALGWEKTLQATRFALYRVFLPLMEYRRQYVDPQIIRIWVELSHTIAIYRRQYVDPHLYQIWAKVQELAGIKPKELTRPEHIGKGSATQTDEDSEIVVATLETPSIQSVFAKDTIATVELATDATSIHNPVTTSDTISRSSIQNFNSVLDTEDIMPHAVTPGDIPTTSSATFSATSSHLSEDVSPLDSHIPFSSETNIAEAIWNTSEEISGEEASAGSIDSDFQEFLRDIVLESAKAEVDASQDPLPEIREEDDLETKKAKTAAERADITGRHTAWEAKLQALKEELTNSFYQQLQEMRQTAFLFLNSTDTDPFNVYQLDSEAEKALRNTETYLKNLKMDSEKASAEKEKLWEKVVTRVEEKFNTRVKAVEADVTQWWQETTDQELLLVQHSFDQAYEMGGKAQTDIGIDYAWLADVTYADWQRYHALMDVSQRLKAQLLDVQSGAADSAPPNPALNMLVDLENELQDIVDGFEVRLTQITRHGYQILSEQETEDPEVSALPVTDDKDALLIKEAEMGILSKSEDNIKAVLEHAGLLSQDPEMNVMPPLEARLDASDDTVIEEEMDGLQISKDQHKLTVENDQTTTSEIKGQERPTKSSHPEL